MKFSTRAIRLDGQRGSGRTTEQMRAAPHGAVYVWVNGSTQYPTFLARHLGRDDLRIISPDQFAQEARSLRAWVVIDHAAALDRLMLLALEDLRPGCIAQQATAMAITLKQHGA